MWASGHSADTVKRAAHGYESTREGGDGGVREKLGGGSSGSLVQKSAVAVLIQELTAASTPIEGLRNP